jgi:hypothetical protein
MAARIQRTDHDGWGREAVRSQEKKWTQAEYSGRIQWQNTVNVESGANHGRAWSQPTCRHVSGDVGHLGLQSHRVDTGQYPRCLLCHTADNAVSAEVQRPRGRNTGGWVPSAVKDTSQ